MSEKRVALAPRRGRALMLVLLGVLIGGAGSRIVRASGPEVTCTPPALALEEPVRVLPPEWRWEPPAVPLDRLYGTH